MPPRSQSVPDHMALMDVAGPIPPRRNASMLNLRRGDREEEEALLAALARSEMEMREMSSSSSFSSSRDDGEGCAKLSPDDCSSKDVGIHLLVDETPSFEDIFSR
eukprot:CAMPEP_0115864312 /NCGR_PEP_ID=MMETSP0287-20121206/19137_1 /TAXON_ID=412157 /ORGANISM="Chrysochromulina rotalis, Strain UIO044" /LENGTH=104 /DNA_ID=CAMNT_0003318781 /DNA_START=42 /DNA_END=356 /DNA_ORIENTATION=-